MVRRTHHGVNPRFWLVCGLLLVPLLAYGGDPYPSTFWSSEKIDDSLRAIRGGVVFPDNRKDLVVIGERRLLIYRYLADRIHKILDYKGKKSEDWFGLTLFDLDYDGRDEILVSGFLYGKVNSFFSRIEGEKWKRGDDIPYFLSDLVWEGKRILVGQTSLGGDDFSGPLFEMVWDGKRLKPGKEIKLPGGLSGEDISIYSIAGAPSGRGGFLHLSPSGKLIFYEGGKKFLKRWTSGENYGGPVITINREVKSVLNETVNKRFSVPLSPRVSREGETFLIKNSGYLAVIGAVPSIKSAQIVKFSWTGYGFQETWNSSRLDGGITDFTFFDWDGDGTDEIVATFLLRDGYFDTLKKQDSLILVLRK